MFSYSGREMRPTNRRTAVQQVTDCIPLIEVINLCEAKGQQSTVLLLPACAEIWLSRFAMAVGFGGRGKAGTEEMGDVYNA